MTNAEIQAGEYVRTKKHGIFKVTELYEVEAKHYILNNDKYETYTIGGGAPRFDISKDIVRHSFNLIDLIEVGDYVNGEMVVKDKRGNLYCCSTYIGGVGITTIECYPTYVYEMDKDYIDTIVTHEQFKNIEYKVGGEDD